MIAQNHNRLMARMLFAVRGILSGLTPDSLTIGARQSGLTAGNRASAAGSTPADPTKSKSFLYLGARGDFPGSRTIFLSGAENGGRHAD